MKKLQYDSKEAEFKMIDKLLKPYGYSTKKLIEDNLIIDGTFWLNHFEFDEVEYNEWRTWCKQFIKDKCIPAMNDEQINANIGYFLLKYPFKVR